MFELLKFENGRQNVPEPERYEADLQWEWVEDAVYSATGTAYTTTGESPISKGVTPSAAAAHYYNSTDEKSWTAVSIVVHAGEAMVLSSGKLVKATGTTKPVFVSMEDVKTNDTTREISVYRIDPRMVFKVETSADASALNIGQKVTIDATGTKVTATTSSGVCTLVDMLGASASGDPVLVRIV